MLLTFPVSRLLRSGMAALLAAGSLTAWQVTQAPPADAAIAACSGSGASFAGGSGTTADPYLVADQGDLAAITGGYLSCSFRQTATIALTGSWTPIGPDTDSSTTWYQGTPFSGEYDGGGFSITGLSISAATDYIALFGQVDGATVRDLALAGSVSGRTAVAAVAGEALDSTIVDITSTVDVTGKQYIGGIVGLATSSTFETTVITASLTGTTPSGAGQFHSIGGLAGDLASSTVRDVTVTGDLAIVASSAGGIVGYAYDTVIDGAEYVGDITGDDDGTPMTSEVGGIAGELDDSSVTDATARSTIRAFEHVGGIVGWSYDNSSFTDVRFDGFITGETWLGGVVGDFGDSGDTANSITRATVTATITGQDKEVRRYYSSVGGLAGDAVFASISESSFTGSLTAPWGVAGGLVGYLYDVRIATSWASGTLAVTQSAASSAGGIGGYVDDSSIERSYADVDVTAKQYSGGLIGDLDGGSSTVRDVYARGDVSGTTEVGGLIGRLGAPNTVERAFSTGTVTGSSAVGGLAGAGPGTAVASFWDTQTSGKATSAAGTAATTAELQVLATFLDAGWSIVEGSDCTSTWGLMSSRNDGYPYLQAFFARSCSDTSQLPPSWYLSTLRADGAECPSQWSPSWAAWPNGGTGGFVCNQELYWDLATNGWATRW